jgi:hypothetical protein
MTARKRRPQKSAKKGPTRRPKMFVVYVSPRSGKARSLEARLGQKREAIRDARRRAYPGTRNVAPLQVSVYEIEGTERPTLIYQVHYWSNLKRLIAEEL